MNSFVRFPNNKMVHHHHLSMAYNAAEPPTPNPHCIFGVGNSKQQVLEPKETVGRRCERGGGKLKNGVYNQCCLDPE